MEQKEQRGLCRFCGQPMKPKGVKKLPDEYDHAQGCPYSQKKLRHHRDNNVSA